jgi:hypothetical protein
MPLVVKDRVKETTSTTGTGTLTLAGAVAGFQSFTAIGNGNTTYYTIIDSTTNAWEVGVGTYTSSGTTLSRDSVLESSNSNNLVNLAAGVKEVFCTYPAERAVDTEISQTIQNKTISGASNTLTVDGTDVVGFRTLPQNSQSTAYTLVLADSGKHILHPSADTTARTFTIPANSSVAFPVGTAITIINQNGAGVVTIAITSDTMRLAGAGTTGSRTLAANGIATAIKITSTEWIISGTGLT